MNLLNWADGAFREVRAFARRFASETRGNVAMIFGISLPVLILMTMGGVDINRASTVRVNLQDALDAAALTAARSPYTTNAEIQRVGMAALKANLKNYPDIMLREADTTFVLSSDDVVIADSKVDVKTIVANIFLPPYGKFMDDYIPVGAHSEVDRSSKNLEVALVLDITGSMSGSKITTLKEAARDLVDTVVQAQQTPFYSRMSIIPYSMGVNLGTYANTARGTLTGSTNITNAAWTTGSSKSITNITRASPGVITSNGHGFVTGDFVWISEVLNMTQINDRAYRVVRINDNTFSLQVAYSGSWYDLSTTSGNGFSSYWGGGIARKCLTADCSVVVTSNNHGVGNGEGVYITGVRGMTQLNDTPWIASRIDSNSYSIGVNGANWGTYSSGGASWCGRDGCTWRVFASANGNRLRALPSSTCVSERAGSNAYTDAYVTSGRVGTNYVADNNPCPASQILPLSSNKTTLKNLINNMAIGGSTAGQIGAAWGWYTVSPNFGAMWGQTPAEYNTARTLKAVILMTDGEFNTPYNAGVIASDAGSGSGNLGDHINQRATNGNPFDQTENLCAAMKARGIIVYTVGFQVSDEGRAAELMQDCATSADYAFLPSNSTELKDAFAAIGRNITQLRISR
ncbi:ubiquitin-activating E1 FCCH domain-containing protein [Brevundimonas kwangchunensis]|uniref:Ubiquitin-activating E1 FCCH domain-containing protein n=1 Tax=Brevundimonas kwangchunensis TaxID=322163 RepID=A0ABN1GQL8_9CAUL